MKKIIVGVLVALVIVFLAVAVSTSANGSKIFQSLSAVLFSQKGSGSQTVAELTGPRALSGPELFGIIRHINTQIDAAVLVLEKEEARLMKARRSGGSSDGSDSDSSNGGGSSGGSSSGSLTPPKPVHAPTPEPITPTPEPEPQPEPEVQAEAEVLSDNCLDTVAVGANVISAIPCFLAKYVVPNYKKIVVPAAKTDTTQDQTTSVVSSAEVASVQTLENLLLQRKSLMTQLAKADPRFFLLSELPESIKTKIADEYQENIEESVTVTGTIEVIHVDDFENHENSYFEYYLRSENQRLEVSVTGDLYAVSGEEYTITGLRIGNVIVADIAEVERGGSAGLAQGPGPADDPDSMGEQEMLVLLINFENSAQPTITKEEAYDTIFNGQFQKFYEEQSYGKIHFSGKVSGWHTIAGNCRYIDPADPVYGQEIRDILINEEIDLSDYDRLVLAIDGECFGSRSTVGKIPVDVQGVTALVSVAWVNTTERWLTEQHGTDEFPTPFSWTRFDHTLSHEIGHGLGVFHANGWECGENILRGDCYHEEYGNYFDTLGTGDFSLHFNAFYKEFFGWIDLAHSLKISQSGQYTINPLEIRDPSAKYLAKIKLSGSTETPFYLEYRKAIGFDKILSDDRLFENQSGIFVNHIVTPDSGGQSFTRLLNMDAGAATGWFLPTLRSSAVFRDPGMGITIGPVTNTSSTSVTFHVDVASPTCVRANPFTDVSAVSRIAIGSHDNVIYTRYGNSDSTLCDESKFNFKTNMSEAWNPVITPPGVVTIPATDNLALSERKIVRFSAPDTLVEGREYEFKVTVENLTSGRESSEPVRFEAIRPPHIQYLLPPRGRAGSHVMMYGSNMGSNYMLLEIRGSEGFQYINDLGAANGILTEFDFPTQICSYQTEECDIDTPPGFYELFVYVEGFPSNVLSFEVIP